MRGLFTVAALIAMAGCSSQESQAPKVAEGGERISCAVGGAKDFSETCAVDRVEADGKLTLVVRHPDGAFRRFAVVSDGRGLVVADGAEAAKTAIEGDQLAVSVAGDRYRFPAKIKPTTTNATP
jgi:hypothetical protein